MSKFSISGLDELIKDLEREAVRAERLAPKMLRAGAKVIVKAQKKEAAEMIRSGKIRFRDNKSRSAGALVESIKETPVRGKGTDAYVEVYPQGDDENEKRSETIRNAEKGFLAEYGTSSMPSYPWMRIAVEKSADEAVEKMQEIWNEEN